MNKRVIVVDWSIIVFRSIYAWKNNKQMPPTYTGLSILISSLKKMGLNKNTEVIIAVDSIRGNWRKELIRDYKGDRKEKREKDKEINWNTMFAKFNSLLCDLEMGTPFHVIEIDKLEADDIAGVASKYYQEKDEVSEIILCSYDHDWEQLWHHSKVKIYSFLKKWKTGKGMYKVKPKKFNAYALIAKMINKETSDNLVDEILDERTYDKREQLVNLLDLPKWIEEKVVNRLNNLVKDNQWNLEALPFPKLRERFKEAYNEKYKITYEECEKLVEKRNKRKR